jgi:hypothetical protein
VVWCSGSGVITEVKGVGRDGGIIMRVV